MSRCPHCNCPLPADRTRLGARCLTCRAPLYEPATTSGRDAGKSEAVCFVHPVNAAIGVCERCSRPLCAVCRTDWNRQQVCVACAERALATGETHPASSQQAIFGLVLGLVAWFLTGMRTVLGSPESHYVFLALSILAAIFGLGCSLAAWRARGVPFILALIGLILGLSQLGVTMGFFLFAL